MNYIATIFGTFGVMKYVLDRVLVQCLTYFQEAVRESSRKPRTNILSLLI